MKISTVMINMMEIILKAGFCKKITSKIHTQANYMVYSISKDYCNPYEVNK